MFKKYLSKIEVLVTELQAKPTLAAEDIFTISREVEKLRNLRDAADTYIHCLKCHNYHRNVFVTLQHLILNECTVPQTVNQRGECFWYPAGITNPATVSLKFGNHGIPCFEFNHIEVASEVAVSALKTYTGKIINHADLNTLFIEEMRLHTGDQDEQT